ncbi:MAG TPA: Coenzyme F420 hydrogenase/dehydrogenase, beta subunit C-terminal domain [Chloroflexia bacterium]|nr:Coenzyme F420 hydrogenase/dehydrogenase, beta subunit C-terminal domain [Chloroflexia bacterium]
MTQLDNVGPLIQIKRKGEADTYVPASGHKTGRRKPLMCSRCGLCYTEHRSQLADACVFVENRYEALEEKLHGRGRRAGSDEDMFGIYRHMFVARMVRPVEGAQWSGIVTSLASLLLEKKLVEGVICVQSRPGTRFGPMPSLATTVEQVRAAAGNKPCLSHNLSALKEAERLGLKRIAFIGNGCQTHALRAIADQLPFEKIYHIGLPCTDIVSYQNLMKFLGLISNSAETVVHLEFMPDYRVWLRHEDGHTEKVSYFALPMDKLGADIFPDSCLSCFDYTNALSDITIGYLGATMPYQWMLVRTETGEELFQMLRPYLEFDQIRQKGKREKVIAQSVEMLENPRKPLPPWGVKLLTFVVSHFGLKGVEFARGTLTMKWARNLHFIRTHYPEHEKELVPEFARRVLEKYESKL